MKHVFPGCGGSPYISLYHTYTREFLRDTSPLAKISETVVSPGGKSADIKSGSSIVCTGQDEGHGGR